MNLIARPRITFGEMSVQILSPLFNWAVCLCIIELLEPHFFSMVLPCKEHVVLSGLFCEFPYGGLSLGPVPPPMCPVNQKFGAGLAFSSIPFLFLKYVYV